MLALAASGLNGQSFAFVGYLPVEATARAARLKELESISRRQHQTQIAIETPYRNAALFAALVDHLGPSTRLCVASGITLPGGRCRAQDDRRLEGRSGGLGGQGARGVPLACWLSACPQRRRADD